MTVLAVSPLADRLFSALLLSPVEIERVVEIADDLIAAAGGEARPSSHCRAGACRLQRESYGRVLADLMAAREPADEILDALHDARERLAARAAR